MLRRVMAVLRAPTAYFQIRNHINFNCRSQPPASMADKTKLIDSMSNLIHHVSLSRKNQQQIFATLSGEDLRKIINNLEDPSEKLRKTTLVLLAELLHENLGLQRRFCQLAGVPDHPGKIVLSPRFPKSLLLDHESLPEVFKLLKETSSIRERGLFWYIDSQIKPRILQVANKSSFNVDPLTCIVGIWVGQQNKQKQRQSLNNSIFIPPHPGTSYKIYETPRTRLNRSHHMQKNNYTESKPETPVKYTFNESSLSTAARVNNYVQQNVTPLHIRSEIREMPKTEGLKYNNFTDRKVHENVSVFDPSRVIKPTSYIPLNLTPRQFLISNSFDLSTQGQKSRQNGELNRAKFAAFEYQNR